MFDLCTEISLLVPLLASWFSRLCRRDSRCFSRPRPSSRLCLWASSWDSYLETRLSIKQRKIGQNVECRGIYCAFKSSLPKPIFKIHFLSKIIPAAGGVVICGRRIFIHKKGFLGWFTPFLMQFCYFSFPLFFITSALLFFPAPLPPPFMIFCII